MHIAVNCFVVYSYKNMGFTSNISFFPLLNQYTGCSQLTARETVRSFYFLSSSGQQFGEQLKGDNGAVAPQMGPFEVLVCMTHPGDPQFNPRWL